MRTFLAFVFLLVASYALLNADVRGQREDCRWMYEKAREASKNIGQGYFGEDKTAYSAEVSAWAALYLACKEAQR